MLTLDPVVHGSGRRLRPCVGLGIQCDHVYDVAVFFNAHTDLFQILFPEMAGSLYSGDGITQKKVFATTLVDLCFEWSCSPWNSASEMVLNFEFWLIWRIAKILIFIFRVGTSSITRFGHHHHLHHRILQRHGAQDFSQTLHRGCRESAISGNSIGDGH